MIYALVVEDDADIRKLLVEQLEDKGCVVRNAGNGAVGLRLLSKRKPDIIFVDIMMPVMDGFETCKRLKEDPETAEISIIFLTAKAEAEDIVKGFDPGAVDYTTKPFNAAELFVRVDSHLTRFRL